MNLCLKIEVICVGIKHLSIRIDETMLHKLHFIADYEGRSANSQINILVRDCIQKYEKEHGEIPIK
nr:Arc family DNA-binding protein [Anaerotignum lactatifermentans]